MTEEEWTENTNFLKDAKGVKALENGPSLLVATIKELFPDGTRASLYEEVEPFFKDFSLKFGPDLTTGPAKINYHLVNIGRGELVKAMAAYLAWLCSRYSTAATRFYREVGLYDGPSTPPRKYRGEPGTRGSADAEPPKPQLRLAGPGTDNYPAHFSHGTIEIVGRETEIETLRRFINPEPGFRWLQLAGPSGLGKSRLAYELMSLAGEQWTRGFLGSRDLEDFQGRTGSYRAERWRQWTPHKPHLIIFDGVIGREADIGYAMDLMTERADDLTVPVRVLLIERQRWDRGGLKLASGESDDKLSPTLQMNEGISHWFSKINTPTFNKWNKNDIASERFRFQSGVMVLQPISDNKSVEIVRKLVAARHDECAWSDDDIKHVLYNIDKSGNPLFCYWLSQRVVGKKMTNPRSEMLNLLEYVFSQHCQKRWDTSDHEKVSWGDCPKLSDDHPALRVALLATMTGFVDCQRLSQQGWGFIDSLTRRQALALVDGPVDGGPVSFGKFIPALEPDILGEWFVLTSLETTDVMEVLTRTAWEIAPAEMAKFLLRAIKNFPTHSVLKKILEFAAPTPQSASAYHRLVLKHLESTSDTSMFDPQKLAKCLENFANNGDTRSMYVLGYLYEIGNGLEESQEMALFWYNQALFHGDESMRSFLGKFAYDYNKDSGTSTPDEFRS